MDFIAIDFETANSKRTSACSLGITTVKDNKIVDTKNYFIKPYPFYFDAINVSIHGITEMDVKDAPTFDILWKDISVLFENKIVVAHNAAFDISVLSRTLSYYNIAFPECDSLCTYKISKTVFPELGCYRLDFISDVLDIELTEHHDSKYDSIACAEILLKYISRYNITDLSDFNNLFCVGAQHITDKSFDSNGFKKSNRYHYNKTSARDFSNIDALYFDDDFLNKKFVFTGTLTSFTRSKAMEIVKKGGGFPQDAISKSTNYLVTGKQDLRVVKDGFSGKMKKAIEYRKKGIDIEIIDEDRFIEMIDSELFDLCTSNDSNKEKIDIPKVNVSLINTDKIFEHIKCSCKSIFKDSPYSDLVSVKPTSGAISVVFCGQKAFDCAIKKDYYLICIKNDYFNLLDNDEIHVEYEINNIKSLPDFTRIFIQSSYDEFKKVIDYIFTFCEAYVDAHYIPDHTFDCCDLYMQCSDERRCTCTDYLYSKCCTYRNKLENGIIFFGKNRNV